VAGAGTSLPVTVSPQRPGASRWGRLAIHLGILALAEHTELAILRFESIAIRMFIFFIGQISYCLLHISCLDDYSLIIVFSFKNEKGTAISYSFWSVALLDKGAKAGGCIPGQSSSGND
jgi:hypothetical protein